MELKSFENLSEKIKIVVEQYDILKRENQRMATQIFKKDKENQQIKKRLEKALQERSLIKQRIDSINEKIDSLECF